MGRSFKCDVGRCALQCHSTSDGWRDAARVPGLPEPTDCTLAPETQEDQLRERERERETLRLTGGERERERERERNRDRERVRMTEWENKLIVDTHKHFYHTHAYLRVRVNLTLVSVCSVDTVVCACVFCPNSDSNHGDDSSSQWECPECHSNIVCAYVCEFSKRTATLGDHC